LRRPRPQAFDAAQDLSKTPSSAHSEILPVGDALPWEEVDEDLDVLGILIGAGVPGAKPPVNA